MGELADYWVWDGVGPCVRVGVHQNIQLANKDFPTVTIEFPWGATTLSPDQFEDDVGTIGELLGVGWHEFESTPFAVPGIWVVDRGESIFADAVLDIDAFGPLRLGQTRSELTELYGVPSYTLDFDGYVDDYCSYVTIPNDPYSPWLMMLGDGDAAVISRIEPVADFQVPASGVGPGSTEAEALEAYPGRITSIPHKYLDAPAAYLLVQPEEESDDEYAILFETNENRHVVAVRNGYLDPLGWVEGCF